MKTIELTDEQWAALQSGEDVVISKPKSKQWEPARGEYFINTMGGVGNFAGALKRTLFGVERNTKEQAEKTAEAMRKFNRLLAYRDEFDPDYEPDWNNPNMIKYFIFYSPTEQKWAFNFNVLNESSGTIYMSRDVAMELVNKLNSGEVIL